MKYLLDSLVIVKGVRSFEAVHFSPLIPNICPKISAKAMFAAFNSHLMAKQDVFESNDGIPRIK
jgi:hypothetical protein